MKLTVILAAKDPCPNQFRRCLSSIAALTHAAQISVHIVHSGGIGEIPAEVAGCFFELRVSAVPAQGVYPAFNRALEGPLGNYVLHLGTDDIVLPGLDDVLDALSASNEQPTIVACHAVMQRRGLFGPSWFRQGLAFRNWCHQAILYEGSVLARNRYDVRYPIQADHKMNIALAAQKSTAIMRRKDIICYFSEGGMSSRFTDFAFRRALPQIAATAFGWPYGILVSVKQVAGDLLRRALGRKLRTAATHNNHP